MLSFGLRLGRPLASPPEGGYQTLEPAVLSLAFDGTANITLNASNTTSYNVVGLPSWCTLTPLTGAISATGDGTLLGHEFFDVELTNASGTTTITNGLKIVLSPSNAKFDTMASVLSPTASETLATASSTITHTDPKYLGETEGLNSFMAVYYTAYGQNTQVLITDSLGVNQYDDSVVFENDNFHTTPYIYIGNGVTYLPHYSTGGALRHSRYDTTTNTMTADVIALDSTHQNSQSGIDANQGLDGRCYTLASQDGSLTLASIVALDVATGASEKWSNIAIADGVSRIGADATHAYFSTNKYGDGKIYSLRLSDGVITDLTGVETAKFDIQQRKNGVVVRVITGVVTTWRHLYNGTMSGDIADLNVNPPWGADATDLYTTSYVTDINTQPSSVDTTAMRPVDGSTDGYIWYKYEGTSPFIKLTIAGVTSHPASLNRVGLNGDNSLIYSHNGYNGFTEFSPVGPVIEHHYISNGVISPYSIATRGDRTVLTGYFGAPMLDYDSSIVWDNKVTASFNPNTPVTYSNPSYKGNLGSSLNVSKAFSSCIDIQGNWWACGEKVRSGEGGGVIYYNGTTASAVAGLTSYEGRSMIANDTHVAVVSILDAGSITISLININTKLVEREIVPDVALTLTAGELAIDAENVYLLTSNDANTATHLYKFLIADGSLIKSNVLSFKTEIGGYNDASGSNLTWGEDGYLYAVLKTTADKTLSRIDSTTLLAEPIQVFPYLDAIGQFVVTNNTIYSYDSATIRSVSNYSSVAGFISQIDPNEPILYLDGVNQFIELGNTVTSANQIANGYTYFFTVKTAEDLTAYLTALQLSEIAVYTGYNYGMFYNNNITGTVRNGAVIAKVLYRCALTYDPNTFTTKLYVNGVETATNTHTGTPFTTGTKWRMTIGARNDNGTTSLYYKGHIGQIQEWNTTFTATQVLYDFENRATALYEDLGVPTTDNPLVNIADCVSWLPLDEGSGIVVNEKINNVTYPISNALNNW